MDEKKRVRKTNKSHKDSRLAHVENAAKMKQAVLAVINENIKIRDAAGQYKVTKSALHRYVTKYKSVDEEQKASFSFERHHGYFQIFSDDEEQLLSEYLITAANMCYGLSVKETRSFAYKFAISNKKQIPESWRRNESAGEEWMKLFRARHKISLRTPEATSLSRATSFNKHNVDLFFTNLREVIEKYGFNPNHIYNCDETAVTTVHRPPKIMAPCGQKQVGKVTSAERGVLVTMCATICANGTYVPPFFIFPRKNFKLHMLNGAPPGSNGAANPSGWMTGTNFLEYLKHVADAVHCNTDNKILIILDNHESHMDVRVLQYCKINGIVLVTLPPHCSHKLQPLDVTCFGPFKGYYNKAMDEWLLNHPGIPVTLYNIADIVGKSFATAFTPSNIIKGFQHTGICPFNSEIFQESDYLCSFVTNRTEPDAENNTNGPDISDSDGLPLDKDTAQSGCSRENTEKKLSLHLTPKNNIVTPESIRPHLKAGTRKLTHKRKKVTSMILTDTPVIEEKKKKEAEKIAKGIKKTQKVKVKAITKKLFADSSDSDVSIEDLCDDSSDISDEFGTEADYDINMNDFVLVKYPLKKRIKYYVGQVDKIDTAEYVVNYLKKAANDKFMFPEKRDEDLIMRDDIVTKLPVPFISGGTERASNLWCFNYDFSPYNIE